MRGRTIGAAVAAVCVLLSLQASASQQFRLLRLGGHFVKWGSPVLGSRATVTYALVVEPRHFAGARNCADLVPIDGMLAASGISRSAFDHELAAAIANWQRVAGITFKPASANSADILIGAQAQPRGWAFTNVADTKSAEGDTNSIDTSLICLNPTKKWKIGLGGDPTIYDLRFTLTHEIGHAIGLDHPGPHGHVMSFQYSEDIEGLTVGDINGAIALYGPRVTDPAAVTVAGPGIDAHDEPADGQSALEPSLSLGGNGTPDAR